MKKKPIENTMIYSQHNLPPDKTDWSRIQKMSDATLVENARSDSDTAILTKKRMKQAKLVKPQSAL